MSVGPGVRLGPYEIIAPLGAGGMAEVYRALDTRLLREVALKILPGDLASDPKMLSRFEAEAKAVAALSHPNILAIFDAGESDGVRYAVTELLEGETLGAIVRRGPVPLRKVIDWGAQAARGLAAAHERQIVHRDIKPENLFLTSDGRLKILDFGLAKHQPGRSSDRSNFATLTMNTDAGTVVGTPWYMSPEQVRGEQLDGRSDIFSLGTVLFELVSGSLPFRAASAAETMASIIRDEPPDLSELSPGASPALVRVIRHCMEKKPERRFQSATDLVFTLEAMAGGSSPRRAEPATVVTGVDRQRTRGLRLLFRRSAPLAVSIVAAGALGFAVRDLMAGRRHDAPRPVSFSQLTDFPGVERQPALSPDGKTVVYVASPRGNKDLFLLRVGGRKPVNLTEDSDVDETAPAFSPDGGRVAFRSERSGGGIFVMEATGESVRRVTDFGHDPSFSPDGKRLVFATEGIRDPMSRSSLSELWVTALDGGTPRRLSVADGVGPRWSPDGKRIAYWGSRQPSRNRDIWTVDAEGRSEAIAVTDDASVDWNPFFSPDGRLLYFGSNRGGTMNLWRVPIDQASGRLTGELEPVTTPTAWSGWFAFSSDGRTLAFSDLDDRSNVWRARFDSVAGKLAGPPESVLRGRAIVSIDFSPDAAWLTFSQRVLPWEAVGIVRSDGGGYSKLSDHASYHRIPRWSPDGKEIVFYSNRDGRVGFYTIRPDGSGLSRLGPDADEHLYPVWSPDGAELAAATFAGGGIARFSAGGPGAGHLRLLSRILEGSVLLPLSWSPDGKRLAVMARGSGGQGASARPRQGVFVLELGPGNLVEIDSDAVSPEWLPDSRRLLLSKNGGIELVDTSKRQTTGILPNAGLPGSWGREIALSRDGSWLAWIESLGEGDIWTMTLDRDRVKP